MHHTWFLSVCPALLGEALGTANIRQTGHSSKDLTELCNFGEVVTGALRVAQNMECEKINSKRDMPVFPRGR